MLEGLKQRVQSNIRVMQSYRNQTRYLRLDAVVHAEIFSKIIYQLYFVDEKYTLADQINEYDEKYNKFLKN